MANILAIETSSVYCSIGISKNKEIFFEHSKEENSHGKLIFRFIDNLLKKAKLKKEDIDFCNCVFEALSDKFTYSEYKQISIKAHSEFTLNEDEKLKDITPQIIDCY